MLPSAVTAVSPDCAFRVRLDFPFILYPYKGGILKYLEMAGNQEEELGTPDRAAH